MYFGAPYIWKEKKLQRKVTLKRLICQLHSDRLMKQMESTDTALGNLVTTCNGELSVILYTQLIWRVLWALTLTLESGNVPWEIFWKRFWKYFFQVHSSPGWLLPLHFCQTHEGPTCRTEFSKQNRYVRQSSRQQYIKVISEYEK